MIYFKYDQFEWIQSYPCNGVTPTHSHSGVEGKGTDLQGASRTQCPSPAPQVMSHCRVLTLTPLCHKRSNERCSGAGQGCWPMFPEAPAHGLSGLCRGGHLNRKCQGITTPGATLDQGGLGGVHVKKDFLACQCNNYPQQKQEH